LNKYVPGLVSDKRRKYVFYARRFKLSEEGYVYVFPSLQDCRERFAKVMGQDINWGEQADWQHEPEMEAEAKDDDELPL
jgi:hypothetical protein